MNRGSIKRKGSGARPPSTSNNNAVLANTDLEKQLEKVRAGTNEELERRKAHVLHELEKQLASADRFRKLQIRNINELYDFEVEDAKARYERACLDIQEQFIAELEAEAERLSQARSNGTENGSHNHETEVVERALRSVGAIKESTEAGSLVFRERQSKKRPLSAISLLDKSIGEAEIRADFLSIVQDMENRAKLFEENKTKNSETVLVDDLNRLCVGANKRFCVGDSVVVYSALSDEHFPGLLTLINSEEVVVRLGTGTRFKFLVSMLRTGRVTISGDTESTELSNLLATEAGRSKAVEFRNHN